MRCILTRDIKHRLSFEFTENAKKKEHVCMILNGKTIFEISFYQNEIYHVAFHFNSFCSQLYNNVDIFLRLFLHSKKKKWKNFFLVISLLRQRFDFFVGLISYIVTTTIYLYSVIKIPNKKNIISRLISSLISTLFFVVVVQINKISKIAFSLLQKKKKAAQHTHFLFIS